MIRGIGEDSYLAIKNWMENKTIENFIKVYHLGFTGGSAVWRVWRIFKNTYTGKYEKVVIEYEKESEEA